MQTSSVIQRVVLAVVVIAMAGSVALGSPGPDKKFWREDDVIFEITGQAKVLSPTSAIQYGYLSSIPELAEIFSTDVASEQNETTALFTFSNTATTLRATVQGGLTVVTREGTMTVYLDHAPNGDFADPATFADGTPVQVSTWRHQVILDSATGRFTVQFTNTITSVTPFDWEGESIRLGQVGKRFRILGSGLLRSPGLFDLAGYAVLAGREILPLAARHDRGRWE
jgi:hypothetical protein